ncbi:MAG: acyl-CoA thioesterase [Planctomycetes bacterium]|nr:acyl-CoA thioesterase [Planctomycetota bacterium]
MGPFRAMRRVEFRDTDSAGIMHFSTYFTKMEEVEHEFFRTLGIRLIDEDASGVVTSWPRVSAQCDYRKAARFGDSLDIDLAIERIGRSSLTFVCDFVGNGERLATGRITAVYCTLPPGGPPEPLPIPDDLRVRLEPFRRAIA